MIAITECPDRERLQALLDGTHDEPELTAHLDGCAQCQNLLEKLAQFTPLPRPRPGPEPTTEETALHRVIDELKDSPADGPSDDDFALDFLTPSERPGSLGKFGKYEVEQVVGRGGMGVVLKALDPDLNRIVAIKVVAPQFAASGSMRRRFVREAKAAAAVCNDHVVTIHDVDTSGTLPYLVMQYVPGPSLQERLDRDGPLELKEILRIGMQTAAGLAAAHAQGLIHRDVKPANILLEDDMERVKLTDFGLARAMDDVRITQSAVLAGTPQYMAPEQARGEALDPRADLFSLGCVLYAACVGRPPFRAGAPLVVMKRICEEKPRSIRDQNPSIPGWLETIVMKL
ncbi:MAG TPA: serine/threonine-protein kinase, partial [Gemmataceae bacterium]|nr:serine/threonine-protein kinase [Gemmataceae bacterium]